MNCIICDKIIERKSTEHIIPEAIGGRKTCNLICDRCNKICGERIDGKFTDSLLMLYIRDILKIKNKDNKTISFFHNHKVKWKNKTTGKQESIGQDEDLLYVRTEPDLKYINNIVCVSAYKIQDIEKMLKRRKLNLNVEDFVYTIRLMYEELECDISISSQEIIPFIIKVSYETAVLYLGESYKNDFLGKQYKEFLHKTITDKMPIARFGEYIQCDILFKDLAECTDEKIIHIISDEYRVYLKINLFGVIYATVLLTTDPKEYRGFEMSNFIEINA